MSGDHSIAARFVYLADSPEPEPEPAARWVALTKLHGLAADDATVRRAHRDVMDEPATHDLLDRLVPWAQENRISGHDKPSFAPNLLNLLADMGVTEADDEHIADCHAAMLRNQDPDGVPGVRLTRQDRSGMGDAAV